MDNCKPLVLGCPLDQLVLVNKLSPIVIPIDGECWGVPAVSLSRTRLVRSWYEGAGGGGRGIPDAPAARGALDALDGPRPNALELEDGGEGEGARVEGAEEEDVAVAAAPGAGGAAAGAGG